MKRNRKGRRRPPVLASVALTLLFVALPAGVYVWGSRSSAFAVKRIEVSGAQRVSDRRALELLNAEYLGKNLFSVRAAGVTKTLRPLVFLDSVSIDRDFPSRLVVRVNEHTPGLYVLREHRWYLVSLGGRVLTVVGEEKRSRRAALASGPARVKLKLPTVAARTALPERGAARDEAVQAALAVVKELPDGLRARLTRFSLTDAGLRVWLRPAVLVDVGDASRLRAKVLSLRAVLGYYASKQTAPTYIDVSIPDRPVARPVLKARV